MSKTGKDLHNAVEVEYYYDSHLTKEDTMGHTVPHMDLIRYLVEVLLRLFRKRLCAIYEDLNVYQTPHSHEYPVAPDIMVIFDVKRQPDLRSWKVLQLGVVPDVVFEIASQETWQKDVHEKPEKYGLMGVQEYFYYDPDERAERRHAHKRLIGWKLNPATKKMDLMALDDRGWLWSELLESWLVPDGFFVRLYDRSLQLRLTGQEAAEQQAEIEAQRAETEAQRAEIAEREKEVFAQRAEAEAQRAKTAEQEKDALVHKVEVLAQEREAFLQKLRSLGIYPDELGLL